jgi:hypothetical protein
MGRWTLFLLLAASGCARPQPLNPYVPPETQYSVGSTLVAAGGLMTAAVGASIAQDPSASKGAKAAGTAATGAGVGLMALSLIDAIEVRKEREKFIQLTRAFYHHYFSPRPLGDEVEPAQVPQSFPDIPFAFREDPAPEDEDP